MLSSPLRYQLQILKLFLCMVRRGWSCGKDDFLHEVCVHASRLDDVSPPPSLSPADEYQLDDEENTRRPQHRPSAVHNLRLLVPFQALGIRCAVAQTVKDRDVAGAEYLLTLSFLPERKDTFVWELHRIRDGVCVHASRLDDVSPPPSLSPADEYQLDDEDRCCISEVLLLRQLRECAETYSGVAEGSGFQREANQHAGLAVVSVFCYTEFAMEIPEYSK
nr:hypothetical protein Iba_chr07aCG12000 [Ipomoea batatas]